MKKLKEINTTNFNLYSPENERANIQLEISRVKNALNKLDNPCINIQAIQVVGTMGKDQSLLL